MKKKATDSHDIQFNEDLNNESIIPEELDYTNERLNEFVFRGGRPMEYHTYEQLINEIHQTVNQKRVNEILEKEGFGSPEENDEVKCNNNLFQPYDQKPFSTRIDQADLAIKAELIGKELKENALFNPSHYADHPELQQKIKDHMTLKMLRQNYFHTSHECSYWHEAVGVSYMDPYKRSIRDKPSRDIITS